jgi:hypothetical protein
VRNGTANVFMFIDVNRPWRYAKGLNMVEIEIGVMVSQCLDRRIPDK